MYKMEKYNTSKTHWPTVGQAALGLWPRQMVYEAGCWMGEGQCVYVLECVCM